MKHPHLASQSYVVPLTVMEFSIMTFLSDNDVINLYDDHNTDVIVTEMNGHFGSNIFVTVDMKHAPQLNKFCDWVSSTINSYKEKYLEGVTDAQNGDYKGNFEEVIDQLDNDEISDEEYEELRIPAALYDKGHEYGTRYTIEYLNSYNQA